MVSATAAQISTGSRTIWRGSVPNMFLVHTRLLALATVRGNRFYSSMELHSQGSKDLAPRLAKIEYKRFAPHADAPPIRPRDFDSTSQALTVSSIAIRKAR